MSPSYYFLTQNPVNLSPLDPLPEGMPQHHVLISIFYNKIFGQLFHGVLGNIHHYIVVISPDKTKSPIPTRNTPIFIKFHPIFTNVFFMYFAMNDPVDCSVHFQRPYIISIVATSPNQDTPIFINFH